MNYELDHTEFDSYAKKVYCQLEELLKRLRSAAYQVDTSSLVSEGVQAFRLQRMAAIKLLAEYIGQEEADEFSKLPTAVLKIHPSMLAINYQYRGFSKQEVENHIGFLSAVMRRVKDGSVEYNGTDIKKKREAVLRELYGTQQQGKPDEFFDDLAEATGLDAFELDSVLEYLVSKNLVRKESSNFSITRAGISEVEAMSRQETPAQRRFRVLEKIYDLADGNTSAMPLYETIEKETQIDPDTMTGILRYLDQMQLIEMGGEWARITARGINQVERIRHDPGQATQYFPPNVTVHNTTVHGHNYGGIQSGGQGNTQNITLTNNPDFERNLSGLIELLRASNISQVDKDDLIHDVERVKQLAQQKDEPRALEKAQKRLDAIKTGIEAVDSGGELIGKALPYITAAWQFLTTLNS